MNRQLWQGCMWGGKGGGGIAGGGDARSYAWHAGRQVRMRPQPAARSGSLQLCAAPRACFTGDSKGMCTSLAPP